MQAVKEHTKIESGLFIPGELLEKVHIENEEIELELTDREIRVYPATKEIAPAFNFNSPLWNCVGFARVDDVSGRDHDRYIYDEEV